MRLLAAIKCFKNKIENEKLTEELENRKNELRRENIERTLNTMTNYLIADMLDRTGMLYRFNDPFIQTEVQRLFWEWKREGIINEFDDFTDETKSWIALYA